MRASCNDHLPSSSHESISLLGITPRWLQWMACTKQREREPHLSKFVLKFPCSWVLRIYHVLFTTFCQSLFFYVFLLFT